MTISSDKRQPINLTDYYLKIPIQSDKRDLPSKIGIYGIFICLISGLINICAFDTNKIVMIILGAVFISTLVYVAIFTKGYDFIGEIHLGKDHLDVKLNSGALQSFQLSDITFKIKYFSFDGKNNFPSKIIGNGLGNIIEIHVKEHKRKFHVYFMRHDIRTLNLYANLWDKNNYKYSFINSWGLKINRLPPQ